MIVYRARDWHVWGAYLTCKLMSLIDNKLSVFRGF